MANDAPHPRNPGPEPDRLKLDEDWESAVKKAMQKKRPKDGWPDEKSGKGKKPPKKD